MVQSKHSTNVVTVPLARSPPPTKVASAGALVDAAWYDRGRFAVVEEVCPAAGGQFRNGTKSDAIDVFTVSASSDGIAASTLVHSVLCLSSARSMLAATAVDGPDVTSQYVLFGGGELKENESHTSTTQDSAIVDVRIYTVYIPPVLFLLRLHKITAPLSTHADGHDCCGCHAYPHRCTTRMLQAGCIHRTT